jgi:hypothetical protein
MDHREGRGSSHRTRSCRFDSDQEGSMRGALCFCLWLAAALAGPGLAHDDNTMGMFFSASDFDDEARNLQTSASPFQAYVVLLEPSVNTVGGYEVGIEFSESLVFVLGVNGPNGWTNFGGDLNHLVGYVTPLPVHGEGSVLCTMQMLYTQDRHVEIHFGPSDPASLPGVPVIADGSDATRLIGCAVLGPGGHVASLNRPAPITDEAKWSSVKSLFD